MMEQKTLQARRHMLQVCGEVHALLDISRLASLISLGQDLAAIGVVLFALLAIFAACLQKSKSASTYDKE